MDKEYSTHEKQLREQRLEDMFDRYQTLMSPGTRDNSSLANDPVYTSHKASEKLKEAIRTRKLGDMTQQEFEDEYKSVLYGISESTEGKEIARVNTSVVPKSIDRLTASRLGHTPQYLTRRCQEYNLTTDDLETIKSLKEIYSTSTNRILKLLDKGYDLEEAGELLEAREAHRGQNYAPTLADICRLQQMFSLPADSGTLQETIADIRSALQHTGDKFLLSTFLKEVKELQKTFGKISYPETALEIILQKSTRRPQLAWHGAEDLSEESFPAKF